MFESLPESVECQKMQVIRRENIHPFQSLRDLTFIFVEDVLRVRATSESILESDMSSTCEVTKKNATNGRTFAYIASIHFMLSIVSCGSIQVCGVRPWILLTKASI